MRKFFLFYLDKNIVICYNVTRMLQKGLQVMTMENKNAYSPESIETLRDEVKRLESVTMNAIENFEERIKKLEILAKIPEDDGFSPDLDTIEIYTMEKIPPLSESIRQIKILD